MGRGWGGVTNQLAVDAPVIGLDDKVLELREVQALLVKRLRVAEAGHKGFDLGWFYLRFPVPSFLVSFIQYTVAREGRRGEGGRGGRKP